MSRQQSQSHSNKKACPVRCSTEVELDVDIKQRAECVQLYKRASAFDVELDIKVDHHCILKPKHVKDNCDPCTVGCVFSVDLDFDCDAKVKYSQCHKPEARYRLDVEIEARPQCKPIEGCKVKYYKKD
jgi:hypothetical protein